MAYIKDKGGCSRIMQTYLVRKFKDKFAYAVCLACVIVAVIPLGSILFEVTKNGLPALNMEFFIEGPRAIGEPGGGIANSIQGTLILIGLTSLIGVPIGILSGIYLAEFGNNKFGKIVRLTNNILAQFPSIVIGIFAYLTIVLLIGSFSPLAGAIALAIIMIPIITRTTEESLKLVPNTLREASMALGIRRWRTIMSIVLVSAKNGVVTGIMLSISRIAGETAPLIMTILGSQWFFSGLTEPMDALTLRIWRLALLPYDYAHTTGWGAALVLIIIVLSLNILARILTRSKFVLRGV
ncbi:MAG: phosphate ABC transporter permease PstA [Nitrososphaeria archaeon]|nr:phosphate ABC transporter permease PstA [Nitrososphaeria archaeon]